MPTPSSTRVERAARRHEAPQRAPVLHAPAFHVARAEHEIGVLRSGEQPRHVLRVVREVAVHLEDQLGAVRERLPERGEVRRPEALLPRPVENVDVGELGRELVGELPGAVRRAVVDDEDARIVGSTSPSARSIGSRFSRSLYVGRQTMARTAVSSRAGWPACPRTPTSPRSSSCWPTSSSSRTWSRSACSPTGGRPRGSARRARPSRRWRSTARRRSSRASARRSRRRSSRSSRTARSTR